MFRVAYSYLIVIIETNTTYILYSGRQKSYYSIHLLGNLTRLLYYTILSRIAEKVIDCESKSSTTKTVTTNKITTTNKAKTSNKYIEAINKKDKKQWEIYIKYNKDNYTTKKLLDYENTFSHFVFLKHDGNWSEVYPITNLIFVYIKHVRGIKGMAYLIPKNDKQNMLQGFYRAFVTVFNDSIMPMRTYHSVLIKQLLRNLLKCIKPGVVINFGAGKGNLSPTILNQVGEDGKYSASILYNIEINENSVATAMGKLQNYIDENRCIIVNKDMNLPTNKLLSFLPGIQEKSCSLFVSNNAITHSMHSKEQFLNFLETIKRLRRKGSLIMINFMDSDKVLSWMKQNKTNTFCNNHKYRFTPTTPGTTRKRSPYKSQNKSWRKATKVVETTSIVQADPHARGRIRIVNKTPDCKKEFGGKMDITMDARKMKDRNRRKHYKENKSTSFGYSQANYTDEAHARYSVINKYVMASGKYRVVVVGSPLNGFYGNVNGQEVCVSGAKLHPLFSLLRQESKQFMTFMSTVVYEYIGD